jgi:hypothetical protein
MCSSTLYSTNGLDTFLANNGAYNSYFKVRYDAPGSTKNEYPPYLAGDKVEAANQARAVAQVICNKDTDSTPGFSIPRKPARIHCIGLGNLFDAVATPGASSDRTAALTLLQELQTIGGTQQSASTPLASDKIIIGDSETRINKLRNTISKIMQDGYSVTLIE